MAPSEGNRQPWRFVFQDGELLCFHDEARSKSFLDCANLASYVSFGAVVENIHLAAEQQGWSTEVKIFPRRDDESLVCSLRFSRGSPMVDKDPLNMELGSAQRIETPEYETLDIPRGHGEVARADCALAPKAGHEVGPARTGIRGSGRAPLLSDASAWPWARIRKRRGRSSVQRRDTRHGDRRRSRSLGEGHLEPLVIGQLALVSPRERQVLVVPAEFHKASVSTCRCRGNRSARRAPRRDLRSAHRRAFLGSVRFHQIPLGDKKDLTRRMIRTTNHQVDSL